MTKHLYQAEISRDQLKELVSKLENKDLIPSLRLEPCFHVNTDFRPSKDRVYTETLRLISTRKHLAELLVKYLGYPEFIKTNPTNNRYQVLYKYE